MSPAAYHRIPPNAACRSRNLTFRALAGRLPPATSPPSCGATQRAWAALSTARVAGRPTSATTARRVRAIPQRTFCSIACPMPPCWQAASPGVTGGWHQQQQRAAGNSCSDTLVWFPAAFQLRAGSGRPPAIRSSDGAARTRSHRPPTRRQCDRPGLEPVCAAAGGRIHASPCQPNPCHATTTAATSTTARACTQATGSARGCASALRAACAKPAARRAQGGASTLAHPQRLPHTCTQASARQQPDPNADSPRLHAVATPQACAGSCPCACACAPSTAAGPSRAWHRRRRTHRAQQPACAPRRAAACLGPLPRLRRSARRRGVRHFRAAPCQYRVTRGPRLPGLASGYNRLVPVRRWKL